MAIDYKIAEPYAGAPSPVSQTETVQRWPLGFIARGTDAQTGASNSGAGEFVYAVGSNCSRGAWVVLDGVTAKQAGSASTASLWQIGVAAGALSATNVYGWVQIAGVADYAKATNAGIAAGASLYLGSAVGRVNSTASAVGFRIVGAHNLVSYTGVGASDAMTVQLYYPMHVGKTAGL